MFRHRGFRPRSDGKSHVFVGIVMGIISGYFIFNDVLRKGKVEEVNRAVLVTAEK